MKILVTVKRVVDYNVKIRVKPDGSGVELANVKMSMNPFDEIGVEEAIRLREAGKATEIVAISMPPESVPSATMSSICLGVMPGEQLAVLVEHARRVGQQHQFLGLEHLGDLAGHDVGVDVVGLAIGADADRRDDRDEIAGIEKGDDGRIDGGDVADLADVDHLVGLVLVRQQQLLGADEVAVLAGQADRLAAVTVDEVDDILVDLAAEHHLDHVHGLFVGDAHALDELALLADAA